MSNKNRNKYHNYNNYNKNHNKPETVVENVEDVVEETVTQNTPVVEEPEVKVVYGVVANCEKLNMRSEPSKQADVIRILTKGDEVRIVETKGEFYAVSVDNGTEGLNGFCMKEFIEIK